ncbi:MAG: membrane protein insertase YidC [Lacticaseibacillus paracasei]
MHKSKKFVTLGLVSLLPLILAACAQTTKKGTTMKPPTDPFFGTFYKVIGLPLQHLMEWIASLVGTASSYGIAIIVITLLVRLIVLPLMLRQQRTMTAYQEKQKIIQPQLKIVQEATKRAKTPEQQMAMNGYMRKIYSANGTSMIPSMGCLPMLIQLPIFSGLYQALAYSPEISAATFFGMQMVHSNFIVTILATLPYIVVSLIMLQGVPPEQRKAMQTTAFLNPIMTFVFCMMYNAGLGLYFGAGGIILIIQQAIVTYVVTPNIRKRMDAEMEENPPVIVVDEHTFDNWDTATAGATGAAGTTGSSKPADPDAIDHGKLRRRNAGKQQRPRK